MPRFERYIGIDYSGAQYAHSPLSGLRVYLSTPSRGPIEQRPPKGHWSRRALGTWLVATLASGPPAIAGIDHGFSFPLRYFEQHRLPLDWPAFLDDFTTHWPTHQEASVQELRATSQRTGDSKWRRLTEKPVGAKSVFHFDVPGAVAKSTHAGLPWLRDLRAATRGSVHFWPYDGWQVSVGMSLVTEAYPSLCSGKFRNEGKTQDQHDAYSLAAWFRQIDADGSLESYLEPPPDEATRKAADVEGWIFGVQTKIRRNPQN